VYDPAVGRMLVSQGMTASTGFSAETWSLNVEAQRWVCLMGSSAGCLRPSGSSPSGRAFAASASSGGRMFIFGGVGLNAALSCRLGTGIPTLYTDIWMLSLANSEWLPVTAASSGGAVPVGRFSATMTSVGRQAGLHAPLVLMGGASLFLAAADPNSVSKSDGSGVVIILNDVWLLDAAPSEAAAAANDRAAMFEGSSLVRVDLPEWCAGAGALGPLWWEMWARPEAAPAPGGKPILLVEARYSGLSVLRWLLVGTSALSEAFPGTYFVLVLVTRQVVPARPSFLQGRSIHLALHANPRKGLFC
jgi:hypothetical protein